MARAWKVTTGSETALIPVRGDVDHLLNVAVELAERGLLPLADLADLVTMGVVYRRRNNGVRAGGRQGL